MTKDQLLGLTSAEWKEISLEELTKILEPSFKVSRPQVSFIPAAPKNKVRPASSKSINRQAKEIMKMVKELNLE